MESIFFCNEERNDRRVLRAVQEVDWKLSICLQIPLRKIHSSRSTDKPLQKSASAASSRCPEEARVLPSRRDFSADSPIPHVGSVTAPQLREQVASTKTNAKRVVWPHGTCKVIQGSLARRERRIRACTQQNSKWQLVPAVMCHLVTADSRVHNRLPHRTHSGSLQRVLHFMAKPSPADWVEHSSVQTSQQNAGAGLSTRARG